MADPIPDAALDQLFREARTFSYFEDREVSEAQIRAIWDLAKMGATSANQQPLRIVWCRSAEAKERLAERCAPGNQDKVRKAPVVAILAHDLDFHEQLPWLFPHTDARSWFTGDAEKRAESAFRNGTLQTAYLMLAARALGLDCGPMSGFDNAAVDAEFLAHQPRWRSNFICSIGFGKRDGLFPRSPRPDFDAFNTIV